jgi:hypothetical protein
MAEPNESAPEPRQPPPDEAYTALPPHAYGLCVRLGGLDGPARTLEQAGVTALVLPRAASRMARDFDGRGDDVSRRDGAVFERADGSRGEHADVWFRDQTFEPKGRLITLE